MEDKSQSESFKGNKRPSRTPGEMNVGGGGRNGCQRPYSRRCKRRYIQCRKNGNSRDFCRNFFGLDNLSVASYEDDYLASISGNVATAAPATFSPLNEAEVECTACYCDHANCQLHDFCIWHHNGYSGTGTMQHCSIDQLYCAPAMNNQYLRCVPGAAFGGDNMGPQLTSHGKGDIFVDKPRPSMDRLKKAIREELEQLKEQNTTSGEFEVNVPAQNEMEKVKIKYGHATGPLDDVTISWGDESHNVDFEEGDQIEDHDNEGKDIEFVAYSQDDKWRFIVTVSVEANYELSGNIQEVDWDSLEIDIDDSKADDEGGKPEGFDDIPDDLREHFKKLAGIIK